MAPGSKSLPTQAERKEIRNRWLLSAPALLIILLAATGPLLIVLVYSFLTPGPYGDVKWQFSWDAWTSVLLERDIFDDTLSLADAHLSILLAFGQAVARHDGSDAAVRLSNRLLHRDTSQPESRELWLFLITIPFWTNLLIRTFAMLEIIRNEGIVNSLLINLGVIQQPIQMLFTDCAIMIGMVYVYLPLMVLPLYASMEKIDFRLVEAGYDLYATPLQGPSHVSSFRW